MASIYNGLFLGSDLICPQKEEINCKHIYTKYFVRTTIPSIQLIEQLFLKEIHLRHLENTHKDIFQKRINNNRILFNQSINKCINYLKIHDYILSLPISSNMTENEVESVAYMIKKQIGD